MSVTLSGATVWFTGPRTRIVDEFGNDGLRNLAHIDAGSTLTLGGHQTVVPGPFTNDGILYIASSDDQPGHFTVTGVLTNFDAASRTLTGGNYWLGAYDFGGSNRAAVFQFAGADIVHNAALLALDGPLAKITDHNGNDALRNFVHNTPAGVFSVAERDFSLGGNFTNEGVLGVYSATLSVAGSLTNFDPATRTLTGGTYEITYGPARFIFEGADIVNNAASIHLRSGGGISDKNANDALRNFNHNMPGGEFTITDSHVITAAAISQTRGRSMSWATRTGKSLRPTFKSRRVTATFKPPDKPSWTAGGLRERWKLTADLSPLRPTLASRKLLPISKEISLLGTHFLTHSVST